ncbi:uncharacterized protein LOC135211030 [Macrobrachium nipponense]|uniref:uncharacterized protein LOC135211030 n=1 Tax=Macrobrachium nipponense TaxID=159736 RepID=UPI0030C814F6
MSKLTEKSRCSHTFPLQDAVILQQTDGTMRKYQQLALTITAVVSLVAFLFYKHEYERLRYTLEYLDTFGQPPSNDEAAIPHCGFSTLHKVSTPPADWVQITSDLEVYSSFFDDQKGMGEPQIKSIAAVSKSHEAPSSLNCLVWFESEDAPVHGSCSVEYAAERFHGHGTREEDIEVIYLLCSADNKKLMLSKTPYMIQFIVDGVEPSRPIFVHESDSLKSVINKSAVCIVPLEFPVTTLSIIEFIAYYNVIGIDKFTAYGPVLTPLARKLLDKYGDESGLEYEEKLFTSSKTFKLTPPVIRKVIELDCLYRHRDTHENVLVLDLNQYVILEHKPSLQDTLTVVQGNPRHKRDVATFHLTSQGVCLDKEHTKPGTIRLSQQTHTVGSIEEKGVAILRPHVLTGWNLAEKSGGPPNYQHVSAATIVVYHYSICSDNDKHEDTHHLPTKKRFVEKVEKSLLYRKWLIYQ